MEDRLKKYGTFSVGFDDPTKNMALSKKQLENAKKDLDNCNAYLLITTNDETNKASACLGKKTGIAETKNVVHLISGFFKWLELLSKDGNPTLLLIVMSEMNKLMNDLGE